MLRVMSVLTISILLAGCTAQASGDRASGTAAQNVPSLKEVFTDAFMIGAALNERQFSGQDTEAAELVRYHFNTATAENVMKWEVIHPEPGRYNFEPTDQFVSFAEENDMFIVGHTLVWHSQTPRWVFQDDEGKRLSRDALLDRMRDHIHTIVGRYRGRVHGWDVVNEALNEDGTLRETLWYEIIGEDYVARAFEYAHEADPDAELYYNDYSLENEPKRLGTVRLVEGLLEQGIHVSGIGTQGHFKMDWPSPEQAEETIRAFAALGVDVMITELDVDVLPPAIRGQSADVGQRAELDAQQNPYAEGLPDSVQQALAARYADLFDVYLRNRDSISRVTLWGVSDRDSWLNNWPVRGRTSYPLLFDRARQPKPAFDAVVETARRAL